MTFMTLITSRQINDNYDIYDFQVNKRRSTLLKRRCGQCFGRPYKHMTVLSISRHRREVKQMPVRERDGQFHIRVHYNQYCKMS